MRLPMFDAPLFAILLLLSCTLAAAPASRLSAKSKDLPEDRSSFRQDQKRPRDFGPGPGKPRPSRARFGVFKTVADTPLPIASPAAVPPLSVTAAVAPTIASAAADMPVDPDAAVKGVYGPAFEWPIIPIHVALLPDGRVLSYGTDERGRQGGLHHAVWDPALGVGPEAHTVMLGDHPSELFCAGQALIAGTGELLITGGSITKYKPGGRNFGVWDVNLFDFRSNRMTAVAPMAYNRWYPTLLTLANGDLLALGGRDDKDIPTYIATPEVYTPGKGWRQLDTASSVEAYGTRTGGAWYYPKAFQAGNGKVFVLGNPGTMYYLDTSGSGAITKLTTKTIPGSNLWPTVMFAPDKLLSLRSKSRAIVVDLTAAEPIAKPTGNISQLRYYSNATVLADGTVVVTGGSSVANQLVDVAYHNELWDPATGQWSRGAASLKPRLYHSAALLLPDGTVLTGGGGAPGPVFKLNSEIYYPPYLFKKDGSGQPAERPAITTAPERVTWQQAFQLTVSTAVSRATLVRFGSATHNFNADQRFIELSFNQTGTAVTATAPQDANLAPPGHYLLFVFDSAGVPSIAKVVQVGEAV